MEPCAVHARAIVVDGCSWTFDGWTEKLAQSGATALNFLVVPKDIYAANVRVQGFSPRIDQALLLYGLRVAP